MGEEPYMVTLTSICYIKIKHLEQKDTQKKTNVFETSWFLKKSISVSALNNLNHIFFLLNMHF